MRKVLGVTLISAALAFGLAGSPAMAARSTTVADTPNDAHRGIDMRAVKVERLKGSIQIRTTFSHLGRNLNGVQYYFDTKRSHPGPEFGAVIYREKDGDHLQGVHAYRMKGWTKYGQEITCASRYKWAIKPNGTGYFTAMFGHGCMKDKANKHVRVAVRTWDYTKYKGQGDMRRPKFGYNAEMGGQRAFSRWI